MRIWTTCRNFGFLYPMKELEDSKPVSFPDKKRGVTFALSSDVEEVTLRPLIKIAAISDGQGQQAAIKTVCAPTELLARPQAACFSAAPRTAEDGSSEKGSSSGTGADPRDLTCSGEAMGKVRGRGRSSCGTSRLQQRQPSVPGAQQGAIKDTQTLFFSLLPRASRIRRKFSSRPSRQSEGLHPNEALYKN